MTTFRSEEGAMFEPGIYKTRNGTEVRVLCNDAPDPVSIHGYATSGGYYVGWTADGRNGNSGFDLLPPVRAEWWVRANTMNDYITVWTGDNPCPRGSTAICYRVELAGDDVVKIERVKRETSNDEG